MMKTKEMAGNFKRYPESVSKVFFIKYNEDTECLSMTFEASP